MFKDKNCFETFDAHIIYGANKMFRVVKPGGIFCITSDVKKLWT